MENYKVVSVNGENGNREQKINHTYRKRVAGGQYQRIDDGNISEEKKGLLGQIAINHELIMGQFNLSKIKLETTTYNYKEK